MTIPTLRERIGRALYEEDGVRVDWDQLTEDRREPWRKDADRMLSITKHVELREALSELSDIVQGLLDAGQGCGMIDSFTLQPARTLLAAS